MPKKKYQNIGMISYFNNRVGNLVIKRFFESNIKIKNVILVGYREKDSVRKNYFNYLNSNKGIELNDLEKYNINFHFVKKINSVYTKNLIKKLNFDILLNFSGIIKSSLLRLPNIKIINAHPGILPFYRGSMCPEWTVINREKIVGATCHLVTKNVDEGPIIFQQKLKYPYPKNYYDFRRKIYNLEAAVLIKGVKLLRKKIKLKIQKKDDGNFYKPMSKKLVSRVKNILKNREFRN